MKAWPAVMHPLDLAMRLRLAVESQARTQGYVRADLFAASSSALERLSDRDLAVYRELIQVRGEA